MKKISLFIALSVLLSAPFSYANNDAEKQKRLQQGKVYYEQVCFGCHTTGFNGAPRLGNSEDWKVIRYFVILAQIACKRVTDISCNRC